MPLRLLARHHPLGTFQRKPSAVDGRGRFTARPGRPVSPDRRAARRVKTGRRPPRRGLVLRRLDGRRYLPTGDPTAPESTGAGSRRWEGRLGRLDEHCQQQDQQQAAQAERQQEEPEPELKFVHRQALAHLHQGPPGSVRVRQKERLDARLRFWGRT